MNSFLSSIVDELSELEMPTSPLTADPSSCKLILIAFQVCAIPRCSSSYNVPIDKKYISLKCFVLYYKALVMAEVALRVTMKYVRCFLQICR